MLRTSGVVIVVSDGWDRGDPALVASETARLQRNCHRLIWLNPLAGTEGYEPLAAGMRAAYPYLDDFVAAGTLASLERLGELLAEGSTPTGRLSGRPRKTGVGGGTGTAGWRGGVHSTRHPGARPGAARIVAGPPRTLEGDWVDPSAARPLG